MVSDGYLSTNNTTHCTIVTVHCNEGYNLAGTSSLTCCDGSWSSDLPSCHEGWFVLMVHDYILWLIYNDVYELISTVLLERCFYLFKMKLVCSDLPYLIRNYLMHKAQKWPLCKLRTTKTLIYIYFYVFADFERLMFQYCEYFRKLEQVELQFTYPTDFCIICSQIYHGKNENIQFYLKQMTKIKLSCIDSCSRR